MMDQRYSKVGNVFALHKEKLGSIPGIPYISLSLTEVSEGNF